ncbi:MAG TPA: hypothetical protein VLB04_12455 [Methanotrichaceae archaeon]|nr:hypothetical protein [Methanotrichaceae archaeon]
MSRLSRLLGLLACLILVPGAYSIEVGFSAEDGGDSVGVLNNYEVSEGVSVKEEAEAKFGDLEMINSREVAGSGNLYMKQEFFGSSAASSYTADRTLQAACAQDLRDSSNANLKPTSFDAKAGTAANAAAGFASTGIHGNTDRCFSGFFAYIGNGFFQNTDSMNIDGGVTGTHSSIYRTTGQNGYLADHGIVSREMRSRWYLFQGTWGEPEPYTIGVDATASAQKTSLDLRAKITVKKSPE